MANTPIPIESLTPISRNDPRAQVAFDGQSIPRAPATRRVKPAPYQRQRVDLSKHDREWTYCRADLVERGDMVTDIGRVVDVEKVTRHVPRRDVMPEGLTTTMDDMIAVGTDIRITGAGGNVGIYDAAEQVRAFRQREAEG